MEETVNQAGTTTTRLAEPGKDNSLRTKSTRSSRTESAANVPSLQITRK